MGGQRLKRGQAVVSILAAANRDPAHFVDPDRIDFHRTTGRHMTFGHGAHFCLGHQLARYELRCVLSSMARQFPDLRLAVDPAEIAWKRDFGKPSPMTLPVIV